MSSHRLNLFALLMIVSFSFPSAFAARSEENSIIPVGLGASSPSFVSGLMDENPAGLTANQSTKGFGQLGISDTENKTGAGGFLLGNGNLGAGLKYSNIRSNSEIVWGVAGRFDHVMIGVSGHHPIGDSSSPVPVSKDISLNAGLIVEVNSDTRVGILARNFTGNGQYFAAGYTHSLSSNFEYSLEAGYNDVLGRSNFTVDPAIGLHLSPLHFSVGYGINLSGENDHYYKKELFYAAGLKLGRSLTITYEFVEQLDHLITLSLALN